ncbi:unnamed protein product [Prunus brigantina]
MGSNSVKQPRQGGKCKARHFWPFFKNKWYSRAALAAYIPSVISLKECTTALEKHVLANAIWKVSWFLSTLGISRRDTIEADGQMLQLWETTDQDASIDLMELGVDKLGISKRFTGPVKKATREGF